ncbi:hypothetical protein DASB73_012530 [Starmerella bacillaris]|uniref:Uncharacterized protein n=1 Tax=Starmerella bacillaris TaxID=1247836 RepID=A0AAV5RFX5_STABA|nr:hypothetical protein DASB73_012530 [Starmerella bacillaris]
MNELKIRAKQTSLPESSKLLPSVDTDHPPIYLKLSSDAMQMMLAAYGSPGAEAEELINPAKSPIESPQGTKASSHSNAHFLTLSITDKFSVLRIGEYEYQGSIYKEPGVLDVYLPENGEPNTWRNKGQVKQRVTLKHGPPLKLALDENNLDLTQPTEAKIINLLSVEPHTIEALKRKAQASDSLVKAVVHKVCTADGDLYTIRPEYKCEFEIAKPTANTTNDHQPINTHSPTNGRPALKQKPRSRKQENDSVSKPPPKQLKTTKLAKTTKPIKQAKPAKPAKPEPIKIVRNLKQNAKREIIPEKPKVENRSDNRKRPADPRSFKRMKLVKYEEVK